MSNVAKHAHAHKVRASVSVGDQVRLVVIDDGVGAPSEVYGGSGLANLSDRAAELGGSSTLVSGERGGARLEWRVPRS